VIDEIFTEESNPSGITRRGVLKMGAVVGGAAWVKPVMHSFVSGPGPGSAAPCTCTGCGDTYTSAPTGCSTSPTGAGTCADGTFGYCDGTVEGTCICNVAPYVIGSEGCTSSSQCASEYGPAYHCIYANGLGPQAVCIQQCCGDSLGTVETINLRAP
jgi:hypothetical protein